MKVEKKNREGEAPAEPQSSNFASRSSAPETAQVQGKKMSGRKMKPINSDLFSPHIST